MKLPKFRKNPFERLENEQRRDARLMREHELVMKLADDRNTDAYFMHKGLVSLFRSLVTMAAVISVPIALHDTIDTVINTPRNVQQTTDCERMLVDSGMQGDCNNATVGILKSESKK